MGGCLKDAEILAGPRPIPRATPLEQEFQIGPFLAAPALILPW
jgi:hypothetical protein